MKPCQFCGQEMSNNEEVCQACGREQRPTVQVNLEAHRTPQAAANDEERRIADQLDWGLRIFVITIVVALPVLGKLALGSVGLAVGLAMSVALLTFGDGFL